jgi:hypothetical protein
MTSLARKDLRDDCSKWQRVAGLLRQSDQESEPAFAASRGEGTSHRNKSVAAIAPPIWAAMKGGASIGRIPAKVSDSERASVTAGFANEVDDVNQ